MALRWNAVLLEGFFRIRYVRVFPLTTMDVEQDLRLRGDGRAGMPQGAAWRCRRPVCTGVQLGAGFIAPHLPAALPALRALDWARDDCTLLRTPRTPATTCTASTRCLRFGSLRAPKTAGAAFSAACAGAGM